MADIQVFMHITTDREDLPDLMNHLDWLPFGSETSVGEWTHTFVCDESEPFLSIPSGITHWGADWYRENFNVLERGSEAERALSAKMDERYHVSAD